MDNNIINSIGTIVSTCLISHFNLNIMYMLPISQLINNVLIKLQNIDYTSILDYPIFSIYNYIIFVILLIPYYLYKYNILNIKYEINSLQKYFFAITYDIYNIYDIHEFMSYIETYTNFIEINSMQKGVYKYTGDYANTEYRVYSEMYVYNAPTQFYIDNIKGTFQTSFEKSTKLINIQPIQCTNNGQNDTTKISKEHVEIPYIQIKLFKNIPYSEFMAKIRYHIRNKVNRNFVRLYGIKPKSAEYLAPPSYELEKNIFFEIERDKYDNNVYFDQYFSNNKKYIQQIINTDSFNLILHGPPGTGKSKLIEVIAKYKERNIISLNLKNLTKSDLNNYLISTYNFPCKKNIYVIEEFDQTFEYLNFRETIYKDKLNTLKAAPKSEVDIVQYMNNHIDTLFLKDLLEIFQSSIPRENQIIIATTNHLDIMKEEFPALFRPGRLTPVEITYLNQESFNELLTYYYKDINEPIVLSVDHNIPTSQIMEIVSMSPTYQQFKILFKQII